jgi:hypothetical protein
VRTTTWTLAALALLGLTMGACATRSDDQARDTGQAGRDTAPGAPATAAAADPDDTTRATGLPAGYRGRSDTDTTVANVSYTRSGDRWEVRTGTRHIAYQPGDTASGNFTVAATIEQLEAPTHREGYGVFIGGQNLNQPSQRYTYFLVGGTGEYLIRVRDGAQTREVRAWTASDAVPKVDAAGKATNRITVRVQGDSVRFLVNDRPVATVPKSQVPTDGIVGLRINHNLHVAASPISITRS